MKKWFTDIAANMQKWFSDDAPPTSPQKKKPKQNWGNPFRVSHNCSRKNKNPQKHELGLWNDPWLETKPRLAGHSWFRCPVSCPDEPNERDGESRGGENQNQALESQKYPGPWQKRFCGHTTDHVQKILQKHINRCGLFTVVLENVFAQALMLALYTTKKRALFFLTLQVGAI